jgi:hypothetical protein
MSATVSVGADGVTLSGPASAQLTTSNLFMPTPVTIQSQSGSVSGSLAAPNSNQVKGFFAFDFGGTTGTLVYPWIGSIGLNQIVGQITDPSSGITTAFNLNMVPPP